MSLIIPGVAVALERVSQEPELVQPTPTKRRPQREVVLNILGGWRLQSHRPQVGVLEVERLQLGHAGKRLRRED